MGRTYNTGCELLIFRSEFCKINRGVHCTRDLQDLTFGVIHQLPVTVFKVYNFQIVTKDRRIIFFTFFLVYLVVNTLFKGTTGFGLPRNPKELGQSFFVEFYRYVSVLTFLKFLVMTVSRTVYFQ